MSESLEGIVKGPGHVRNLIGKNMPHIREEIETIINSKDQSEERIEHILTTLTDYSTAGIGEPEFKKLNEYYATFNKPNSEEYERFFKDLNS